MQCAEKSEFGVLGMMIFIGWTVSAAIIPRLSDLYGRKKVYVINMLIQLVALLVMIFAKSYKSMATGLFLIGVCSAGRWTVAYVYLMEFWTEAYIKKYAPFVNASAALALIIGAFTIQVLTKNTIVLEYLAAVLTVLSGLLGLFLLPESPKWLVNRGYMEEARLAYIYIAKVNSSSKSNHNTETDINCINEAEKLHSNLETWQFLQ